MVGRREKGSTHSLLVGLRSGVATQDISVVSAQKPKTRSTTCGGLSLWPSQAHAL